MKKTYIIAAILLILAVVLGGCAKNESDISSSAPVEKEEQASSFESEAPELHQAVVNVFVPSSMTLSMNDLIEVYKAQEKIGGNVVANYSDSVSLGRQIENHADCDIFICEDSSVLDQLEQEQYVKADSRASFSDKEIVLTVSEDKPEVTEEAQAFYEFLLSEEAQKVMNESLDNVVSVSDQENLSQS